MLPFWRIGYVSNTVLGFAHIAKQLLFSILPVIMTFKFDLVFGVILTFWGPNGLFLGLEKGSKTCFWSTHMDKQLLFSRLPSILTFDVDLILGSFLAFGA